MPSESKPRHGRNRSKNSKNKSNSRVARKARSKMQEDNFSVNLRSGQQGFQSQRGHTSAWCGVVGFLSIIGAKLCQFLLNLWAHRHVGLIVLFLGILAMLCFLVTTGTSGSIPPNRQIIRLSETFKDVSTWNVLMDFFCPTTCIMKDNQLVNACTTGKQKQIDKGECLRSKCCFSSFGDKVICYYPISDKPTQMFRIFGFLLMMMVVLGFLPIYCFSFCQKSPWFNPLRKINSIMANLKKHKDKLQKSRKARKTKNKEETGKEAIALLSH